MCLVIPETDGPSSSSREANMVIQINLGNLQATMTIHPPVILQVPLCLPQYSPNKSGGSIKADLFPPHTLISTEVESVLSPHLELMRCKH